MIGVFTKHCNNDLKCLLEYLIGELVARERLVVCMYELVFSLLAPRAVAALHSAGQGS